jgi:hypothetical protein
MPKKSALDYSFITMTRKDLRKHGNKTSSGRFVKGSVLGAAVLLLSLQLFLWARLPPPSSSLTTDVVVPSERSITQTVSSVITRTQGEEEAPSSSEKAQKAASEKAAVDARLLSQGIAARPFEAWRRPLPCFPSKHKAIASHPTNKGFFFMKLMKTGGSTAAGIHVRMVRNIARRLLHNKDSYCQGQWDHDWAYTMLKNRNRDQSFTWTLLRDPTARVVSQFFHFEVTRNGTVPTDDNIKSYLRSEYKSRDALYQYYLRLLSIQEQKRKIRNVPTVVQQILSDYDFIGITERMDESAVTLMMLLDLKLSDILFLDSKASGGYDDGQGGKCLYIQPSILSAEMIRYFDTPSWKHIVQPDTLLYDAANRALDLTIDSLGRQAFEENLVRFRRAQTVARDRCLPRQVFPCTSAGERNPHKSCLWKDSGCGSDCLDEVATELKLW